MTSRKTLLLLSLGLPVLSIEIGAACSSSETHFMPPPATSVTGTTGGHNDGGKPDVCRYAIALSDPACHSCNIMVADPGEPCAELEMTCANSLACTGDSMCVGGCDIDAGQDAVMCISSCLAKATQDYKDYITCVGENCAACVGPATVSCETSDGGADGGTCSDGEKNGDETDVDCGGTSCGACGIGKGCKANSDCDVNSCVSSVCACPMGMIAAPITGGGGYCIDVAEVTNTQYQTFYSANPPTSTQPAECAWNTGYTPAMDWPASLAQASLPVRYVNWCQAADYCAFAKKRLCGMVGGGSVPLTNAGTSDDQWFNACSQGGQHAYPYGDTYNPTECNGADAVDGGSTGPWSESQNMTCNGGVPGVYDMSGNVAEWEDACDGATGASDTCLVRGGSFQSGSADLTCGVSVQQTRDYTGPEVGFRCCL